MTDNLNGILGSGVKLNTNIYRTIPCNRLIELLTLQENVLVRPKIWPDTFKDLLGKSFLRNEHIKKRLNTNHIYGQCWTLHTASYAIWQIYSNGTDGFRIRTKVGKLLKSLKDCVENPDISCYIGKVKYLNDAQLIKFGQTHFTDPTASQSEVIAGAYLVKRKAFEHEKEVRLIYQKSHAKAENDLFSYAINPHQIIDQIMIHPLTSYEQYIRIKQKIQEIGFTGEIKRSLLYSEPEGFEFQFGSKDIGQQ